MNSKRKADLQRKLSMVSVPKPPAGLADRIKNDIPEYLGTSRERERFNRSVAFNLRVAASVILLVGSTVFCLHLFNRASMDETHSAPQAIAAVARVDKKADVMSNATPPPFRQRVIAPNVPPVAPQPVSNLAPPPSIAERIVLHRAAAEEMAPASPPPPQPIAAGAVADSASMNALDADAKKERDSITVTAEAPLLTTTTTVAAPAPVTVVQPALAEYKDNNVMAKTISAAAAPRAEMVPSVQASDLNLAARNSAFGFSVSDNAFDRVKSAIERGEHPSNVDVEGLVNYFAGAPERSPREVALDVEGSPAPIEEGPRTVFVRYSVDTTRDDIAPHSSVPPVATNAHVEIEFDPRSVASYRRIGGDSRTDAFEPSLLKNVSVTVLYAVELKPNVTARTPLATITLHYNSVTNGRVKMDSRTLCVSDVVARPWGRASRRHRLASLGAVWGEKLKMSSTSGGADVARRAEELSKQEPKDERAKELATLTNASSR